MKNVDTKYWLELTLVTVGLIALGWIGFVYVFPGQYPRVLPIMLALLLAITISGHVVLSGLLDKKFSKFAAAFNIYKGLKILILATFMVIYLTLHKDHAIPFLGATFVMYLVYMLFEVRSLNKQSRKQLDR